MQLTDLIETIVTGAADDQLSILDKAIKERKALLSQQKSAILKVTLGEGSRVRFTDNIRPKYLAGVGATIVKVNPKKVLLKVDERPTPFTKGDWFGRKLNCPLSLIEAE